MQFSEMKSTMPLAYLTIAPGAGQAFRQPGSRSACKPSLRISHSRFAAGPVDLGKAHHRSRLIGQVDRVCRRHRRCCRCRRARSFHCMHATWQALQPMHLEMSISFATGVAGSAHRWRRGRGRTAQFNVKRLHGCHDVFRSYCSRGSTDALFQASGSHATYVRMRVLPGSA